MNTSIGILAHVDAGKTTLAEQMLFQSGALRSAGRVDHGDTLLDGDDLERRRGITIFSGQAPFTCAGRQFTLVDTPGHVDFVGETERALDAMDAAILLMDGSRRLQPHTIRLFTMARAKQLPVFLFINKTDLTAYDPERAMREILTRLTPLAIDLEHGPDPERLAELDDDFCEKYLSGEADRQAEEACLRDLIARGKAFPVLRGAALAGRGVAELLDALARWLPERKPVQGEAARALVYKIRREGSERVVFLKVLSGTLSPRDAFSLEDTVEKIHQLRVYHGSSWQLAAEASAGDVIGVTGLALPRCGDTLENGKLLRHPPETMAVPVLSVRVLPPEGVSQAALLEKCRILEEEDPLLGVEWDEHHGAVLLQVMGTVQVEILSTILRERFGMEVSFQPPLVLYKETLAAPAVGVGHYEPLRHYAEAHLLMTPAPRGSGYSYESRCHVDDLPMHFQKMIRTHTLERRHRGVLTGSPLTDIRFTLLSARFHLKHTDIGDFREAVYRAVRQGLMHAESLLLEPYYRFTITVPQEQLGRLLTDLPGMHCECGDTETLGEDAILRGRGPVSALMDYPVALRSLTRGRGTIELIPDGYDICREPDRVIREAAYDPEHDTEQSPDSIFCSHGAGFPVKWTAAGEWMHLPVETVDEAIHSNKPITEGTVWPLTR